MKKHKYIGYIGADNAGTKYGCILKSPYTLDEFLKEGKVEQDDFIHDATNWNGLDEIERTLELEHLELTGRGLQLVDGVLAFSGEDHDMWHIYPWKVTVKEIWEVKE